MDILIVTRYKKYPGGVETFNEILTAILERKGHHVDYLTAEDEKSFCRYLFGPAAITRKKFSKLTKKYDVVICNGEFSWGIKHQHLINVFHGSYIGLRDFQKGRLNLRQYLNLTWHGYIQKWAAKGNTVVAVSFFIAEILNKQGISVSAIIENCVDTEKFIPGNTHSKSDLFVGSYNYFGKGFDILESLASKGLNIACMTNKQTPSSLKWLRPEKHEQMPAVYQSHHLLIFPSRFEAGALVPLEAMACGLPVITGRTGYGMDIEKEIPEFVVSEMTAEAFLEKRKRIEEKYVELSQRAREYVLKKHSLNHFAHEWIKLVELK